MSRPRTARNVALAAALIAGALAAAPAAEAELEVFSGWAHRDDGRAGTDRTATHDGADLWLSDFNDQVSLIDQGAEGGGIEFVPPAGQTLETGVTYPVGGAYRQPTATTGQVLTYQDGLFCGRTEDELGGYRPPTPAVGWFRVEQIDRVDGDVVAFAATYEVSCQYVNGPLGFEGSVAYRAAGPVAPIPPAPAVPSAVTGLKATNTDPDTSGNSTTTLSWTNPARYADLTLDMVQLCCDDVVPPLLHGRSTELWRGRASSYFDRQVEFMDGRIYRVVPRGPTGRVGRPAHVTVIGSRLNIPPQEDSIQIGQESDFSGRLTKSSDLATSNTMSGPPLAGRTVVLCQQDVGAGIRACNPVDRAVTNADGRFRLSASPVANSWYTVMAVASSGMIGNRSHLLLSTGVAPQTDLALRSTRSQRAVPTVRRGSVIRFTTSRARRGSTGVVRLQRLTDGKWRTVVTRRLGTGRDRLVIRFRESRGGLNSYRVVKTGDARHVNGYSRIRQVRVR